MAGETEARAYRWVLPLIVGVFCGGLGGSIFTWYMNRPKPTVATYRISTTTLSAPEALGLIPDLKVLIGGNPIHELYAHNIELLPRQGPFVDQAEVAFSFSAPVRIYGIHMESPSVLHHLECSGFAANAKGLVQLPDATKEIVSIQCTMRPILFQGNETQPFRIAIATDRSEAPRVLIAAKGVELAPADVFVSKDTHEVPSGMLILTAVESLLLGGFLGSAAFDLLDRRRRRRRSGAEAL
jgi:hypothetical protein